jgi:hypothetical protein
MFVFACSVIAKSQCWLFALGANMGQISVFALKYPHLPSYVRIFPVFNFRYLRSGLKDYNFAVKVQGKMMHKDMHQIVFQ